MHLPCTGFYPVDLTALSSITEKLTRQQKRLSRLISAGSPTPLRSAERSWSLRFMLSPRKFLADSWTSKDLVGVFFKRNKLEIDPSGHSAKAITITDPDTSDLAEALNSSALHIPTSLAFRSIGYAGTPISGLAEDMDARVDERAESISNDGYGRVLRACPYIHESDSDEGMTVPGLYVTGWAKNGPSGVIASTMVDAFTVGDTITSDLKAGRNLHSTTNMVLSAQAKSQQKLGWLAVQQEVVKRGLRTVDWKDWQRIDEVERERGKRLTKEREKLITVKDMLSVIDQ